MITMTNVIDILVPKVHAQDATSQPTFGSIDVGGGTTSNALILLTSRKTSVKVGDKFKVKVHVKTNGLTISEYRLVIDFDPAKLTVIDQDSVTDGTQIKLLDTVFTVADPTNDNTVSSVGRIRLNAAVTGQTQAVDADVAEIEFQAQALGTTTVKVVEGVTGSQIVREAGVGLGFTANEV